ncbi:hypothetical protein GCM10027026_40180 [Myroides odoratimimus subsp. xuanwuensis]
MRLLLAVSDGPAPIVHRGLHAVYVELAGRCVGVVSTGASAVPCAMRVSASDVRGLSEARSAWLAYGALRFDDTVLRVGRVLDVAAPAVDAATVAHLAEHLRPTDVDHVRRALPERALADLAAGDPLAVPALVGLGDGLTPLGDDVLCGWLALRHAAGAPVAAVETAVRDCLGRTTLLSATLLDCAAQGEVVPEFAALLRAADRRDETGLGTAAAALTRVGHTSGAGLLLGASLAAHSLSTRSTRTNPTRISEGRRCA